MVIVQGRSQQEKRTGAPVVPPKNAGHVTDGTHQIRLQGLNPPLPRTRNGNNIHTVNFEQSDNLHQPFQTWPTVSPWTSEAARMRDQQTRFINLFVHILTLRLASLPLLLCKNIHKRLVACFFNSSI